jgi:hypothetical protein
MNPFVWSLALAVAGADPGTPAGRQAVVDWSGFASAGHLIGEVVKADDAGLTVRVSWATPSAGRGGHHQHYYHPGGGIGTPQQLAQHLSHMHARVGGGRSVKGKPHHADYDFAYAANGLARHRHLPPKVGADGKPVPHTQAEMDALHLPPGATGYAAEKGAIHPGTVVELHLVRPQAVPAAKATAADLSVKYAVILDDGPRPTATAKK